MARNSLAGSGVSCVRGPSRDFARNSSLSGQPGYLVLLEQRDRVGSRSGKTVVPAGRERDVIRDRVGLRFSTGWKHFRRAGESSGSGKGVD